MTILIDQGYTVSYTWHCCKVLLILLVVSDVAPHGQILHEHLEVEVVLDRVREALQVLARELLLAQQPPRHVVHEGDLVR